MFNQKRYLYIPDSRIYQRLAAKLSMILIMCQKRLACFVTPKRRRRGLVLRFRGKGGQGAAGKTSGKLAKNKIMCLKRIKWLLKSRIAIIKVVIGVLAIKINYGIKDQRGQGQQIKFLRV